MRRASLALVLFLILGIISFSLFYYAYSTPKTASKSVPLFDYRQQAEYYYVASLKPNALYTTPTLAPGQGTLFTSIVGVINLTLTYSFGVSVPSSGVLTGRYAMILWSPSWNKTLQESQLQNVTLSGTNLTLRRSFEVNTSAISNLASIIGKEIGQTTSKYAIQLKPELTGNFVENGRAFTVSYNPSMNFTFYPSGTLVPYGLRQSSNQTIYQSVLEPTQAGTLLVLSYLLGLSSAAGVIAAGVLLRLKPTTNGSEELRKMIEPYREIVVDTVTPPPSSSSIVTVAGFDGLVRVADNMAKPVLHFTGKGEDHTFYVVDYGVVYVFQFKQEQSK